MGDRLADLEARLEDVIRQLGEVRERLNRLEARTPGLAPEAARSAVAAAAARDHEGARSPDRPPSALTGPGRPGAAPVLRRACPRALPIRDRVRRSRVVRLSR